MEIHQLVPGLHPGDAISNHALALRKLLRAWGHHSDIFARDISPAIARECRHFNEFACHEDAVTIYHYSMDFDEMTRLFMRCPGKRMLIYHNITPAHYLKAYNHAVAQACHEGRERLAELRDSANIVFGDSEFNCAELEAKGFPQPRVLPILVNFEEYDSVLPCAAVREKFDDDWMNLLFVGRLSPNKCQDDVIRTFAHYNRFINRRSRLFLVGSWRGMERYLQELRELVNNLELDDYVFFTGHVKITELVAYYCLADLFVCMSEHEGFCVPILEAMHFDVPVLAYHAAAIPGTLENAGVMALQKDYAFLAEMAHLMISDQEFRDAVLHNQGERVADFRPAAVAERFRSYLQELNGMEAGA
jgi:glycosyltransferase involved in cell wall biosynthesis